MTAAHEGSERLFTWIFILLVFLHLALIWAFPYFPSQDGPIHLGIAQTLADYDNPAYPVMAEYFEREWSLQRNPFTSVMLGTLGAVVPLLVAEKIYLSLIVVLLPLSFLYALRGITRHALYAAFFAFPLTYSYTLMMGLHAFSFGLSMFLLTIGLWLRFRERWTVRRVALFAGATFVAYVCHIFAAFNVLLFVGLATLWELARPFVATKQWPDFRTLTAILLSRGVPPLIAVLPVLVIVLTFMVDVEPLYKPETSALQRLIQFVALTPTISYTGLDFIISISVSVLVLVGLLNAVRDWRRNRTSFDGTFLFVFVGYFLFMLFVPFSSSGSHLLLPRLMNFVFFALIFALVAYPLDRSAWRVTASALMVVSLVNLGYRYLLNDLTNDYLAEYLSGAELIEPNSTVLALDVDVETGSKLVSRSIRPFVHATGYLVVSRHVVDLRNYQASHGLYFPIYFREELDPYEQLTPDLEHTPPLQLKLDYPPGVAGRIDYVLLWGALDSVTGQPGIRELTTQLELKYDLLFVSREHRLMRLYRRKKSTASPAGVRE